MSRASVDRALAVVLHLRMLLRVLLGPLQVVSGLTDPGDRRPELLGVPVWTLTILLALRADLGGWSLLAALLLGEGVVAGLRLSGYRTPDL